MKKHFNIADMYEMVADKVPARDALVSLLGAGPGLVPVWEAFDQHGLIVDLKTAERFPSGISDSHGRQGAVYAAAHGNYGMRFAYVKPSVGKKDGKAVAVYEMSGDDVHRHLEALRQIAIRLGRFLSISGDPDELAGLMVPDYDAFYWNNTTTRANGTAVYGF